MKYYSLHHQAPESSFKEAVIRGLAPDRGLYFPKQIPKLPATFFEGLPSMAPSEMAFEMIQPFVGNEIPEATLKTIVEETLSFDFPLVQITSSIAALELFHGPTMAFKDVGARFMARCLGYFNKGNKESVTVLVATSGDTGGAVADGFYKVSGVEVVILYPKGKVSDLQEKQLTTLGENITAIEVEGTFDDCQKMVKEAFLDSDFDGKRKLTSANSINVARWLPQMFYYVIAYSKLMQEQELPLVFSVPSGNYGNICAGMMAQQMGLPIQHFVAGTNSNAIVPQYLETGKYHPMPSKATISNAMDVGDPSNFIRIQELFQQDFETVKAHLSGYAFSDTATQQAIQYLYEHRDYIADPHGAVGYMALKEYLKSHPNHYGVFLETAHPVKFLDVFSEEIKSAITLPNGVSELLKKEKKAEQFSTYDQLKQFLLA